MRFDPGIGIGTETKVGTGMIGQCEGFVGRVECRVGLDFDAIHG